MARVHWRWILLVTFLRIWRARFPTVTPVTTFPLVDAILAGRDQLMTTLS